MTTTPSNWKAPVSNSLTMPNTGSPPAKFNYGFCQVSNIDIMYFFFNKEDIYHKVQDDVSVFFKRKVEGTNECCGASIEDTNDGSEN